MIFSVVGTPKSATIRMLLELVPELGIERTARLARLSTPASDSRDRPRAFRSLASQLTGIPTSRRLIELLFD